MVEQLADIYKVCASSPALRGYGNTEAHSPCGDHFLSYVDELC